MRIRNPDVAPPSASVTHLLARAAVLGAAATVPMLGIEALELADRAPALLEPVATPGRAFSPMRLTRAGRRELRLGVLALAGRRPPPALRQETLPW